MEKPNEVPDDEKVDNLVSTIIRVCDWKGCATLYYSKDGHIWVEEHRAKILSYDVNQPFRFVERIRETLESKEYRTKENIYINLRYYTIEPKESATEFYVLVLDVINAPDEIKKEFEQFRGKLIRIKELPKEFEIKPGALGTFLLYRGFVCSRIFFSHSKSGWFNLTFDEPQTPEEYIKEYEERKKNA